MEISSAPRLASRVLFLLALLTAALLLPGAGASAQERGSAADGRSQARSGSMSEARSASAERRRPDRRRGHSRRHGPRPKKPPRGRPPIPAAPAPQPQPSTPQPAPEPQPPAPAPSPQPPAPEPQPPAPELPAPNPEPEPEPPTPEPEPPAPEPEPEPPAPEPEPPAPEPEPEPTEPPLLDAGFESGLLNWNTAGVGDVVPTVVSDVVRSGAKAARVRLSGEQDRSELILGGRGNGSNSGTVEFHEGDEYWYAFSFYIESMVYGRPGAHNLIMQLKGSDSGSPGFGLMLWDYQGKRGLWTHGRAAGGDRFLAAVPERAWHDVVIHFVASRVGQGSYEVYLNGKLVDSRTQTSVIASAAEFAYIKSGLYRNGDSIPGTSEIRLDAARLGTTRASVAF